MPLTRDDLIQFMDNELGVDTSDIDNDTALFSSGIIDSFALVTLITYIEKHCEFRVNPVDVNLDNMDSIDRILSYVDRKKNGTN